MKRLLSGCVLSVFLAAPLAAFTPSGLLEIHHINVQQGAAALVIGPDGTTVLLDAGKNGKGPQIVAYLQGLGITTGVGLDYTVAGHLDSDHVGGFDEVFDAGYDVAVQNFYNGSSKSTSTIDDYLVAASLTTAGYPAPALVGETVALGGGATLTFVAVGGEVIGHGTVSGATNENDLSIAVLIEHGDFDYIWASDLGGGDDDNACTGRSTSQANVETPLAQAITPGGAWPLLSAAGVDVMQINHHGSESSTNSDYMNLLAPEVAVVPVGAGQSSTWHHPRKDVVESVLLSQASCVTAPPALVLQTEEGDPTGSKTSFAGYAVGDIVITTDGVATYLVDATGGVSQGPDERSAAGLPAVLPLDEQGGNVAPSAAFTHGCNGLVCNFTDTSADSDGVITTWSWSFGDGGTSSAQDPGHTFAAAGTYTVTLTVTDDGGAQGVTSQEVTVTAGGGGGGLVLSEVFYDASGGDNGLEWVELYNGGSTTIDLSGYSLGNGGGDYTTSKVQLAGTLAPGATFVVGGPTSSSANANPSFDQSINFAPDFQNAGSTADGVALFDLPASQVTASTVPIDAVVYGGSNTSGLIDESGAANPPEVGDAPSGDSIERVDLAGSWQIQPDPTPNATPFGGGGGSGQVVLSEVFYDASGGDDGLEWIELYNSGTAAVDLSGYSLGGGGSDYTYSLVQLAGTIAPGATFVVGGPTSSSANANPSFDQTVNFAPDLQNAGSTADGVALFDLPAAQITGSTVPIDAVIYGGSNASGLIDESGAANAPEVGDAPSGDSIERVDLAGSWQIQASPTPNSTPLP